MPKSARKPRKATLRRRATILDAALRCFTRQGLAKTTIADVRKASRASTGSIYHQFSSKENLAAALYVDTVERYQAALIDKVERAGKAERRVRTIVEHHLDWVARNPARARFLLAAERPAAKSEAAQALSRSNKRFFDRLFEWVEPEMHRGAIRSLPRDLFLAIVIGPPEAYARAWLEGRRRSPLARARRALADAAWTAVRARR